MATPSKIKRHPITNEWTHYYDIDGTPYWIPGILGEPNFIIDTLMQNPANVYAQIDNQQVKNIYIDINNGIVTQSTVRDFYDKTGLDTTIFELLPVEVLPENIILENIPTIIEQPFEETEINIIKGAILTTSNLKVISQNPESQFKYDWILRNKSIGQYSRSLEFNTFASKNGSLYCNVTNESGSVETDRYSLNIIDLNKNKYFGKNLIKDYDPQFGIKGWDVIEGEPITMQPYSAITYKGTGGDWSFTGVGISATPDLLVNGVDIEKYDKVVGPTLQSIDNEWIYTGCFLGGSEDTSTTLMYYDIDLVEVSDIIDRKYIGLDNIYGRLFGWLGSTGVNTPYINDELINWDYYKLRFSTDTVTIEVKLLDEFNNELPGNNMIYSPINRRNQPSFYLRDVEFYIPSGTRRIRLITKFKRAQNLGNSILKGHGWVYKTDKERAENHRSYFTHLNLMLFADNWVIDKYENKLYNYKAQINKPDEYRTVLNVNNEIVNAKEYQLNYTYCFSSLITKINELKNKSINDIDIIDILLDSKWFSDKFYPNEMQTMVNFISNPTWTNTLAVNDIYNNRVNNKEFYLKYNDNQFYPIAKTDLGEIIELPFNETNGDIVISAPIKELYIVTEPVVSNSYDLQNQITAESSSIGTYTLIDPNNTIYLIAYPEPIKAHLEVYDWNFNFDEIGLIVNPEYAPNLTNRNNALNYRNITSQSLYESILTVSSLENSLVAANESLTQADTSYANESGAGSSQDLIDLAYNNLLAAQQTVNDIETQLSTARELVTNNEIIYNNAVNEYTVANDIFNNTLQFIPAPASLYTEDNLNIEYYDNYNKKIKIDTTNIPRLTINVTGRTSRKSRTIKLIKQGPSQQEFARFGRTLMIDTPDRLLNFVSNYNMTLADVELLDITQNFTWGQLIAKYPTWRVLLNEELIRLGIEPINVAPPVPGSSYNATNVGLTNDDYLVLADPIVTWDFAYQMGAAYNMSQLETHDAIIQNRPNLNNLKSIYPNWMELLTQELNRLGLALPGSGRG